MPVERKLTPVLLNFGEGMLRLALRLAIAGIVAALAVQLFVL